MSGELFRGNCLGTKVRGITVFGGISYRELPRWQLSRGKLFRGNCTCKGGGGKSLGVIALGGISCGVIVRETAAHGEMYGNQKKYGKYDVKFIF